MNRPLFPRDRQTDEMCWARSRDPTALLPQQAALIHDKPDPLTGR